MAAALIAFGLTFALCPPVLVGLRRWRLLDVPGDRSSHVRPTPRGGGIALAIGATVALAIAPALGGQAHSGLLAAGLTFGAIGLVEDAVGVPALRRLLLQVVAGALTVSWLLSAWGGSQAARVAVGCVVALWLVSYVNAFNFMDGIDGISVAQVVVAGAAWFAIAQVRDVPALETGSLVVVGAALGFAPFNVPQARMFLGDVGSYFLGAWLASLAVIGLRAGVPPEAVIAPLSLYLADTGLTLAGRVRRGEVWHAPHRDHAYQRLVQLGWSHARTTLAVTAVMAAVSGLGALALVGSTPLRVAGDIVIVAILTCYLMAPSRMSHRPRPALVDRT